MFHSRIARDSAAVAPGAGRPTSGSSAAIGPGLKSGSVRKSCAWALPDTARATRAIVTRPKRVARLNFVTGPQPVFDMLRISHLPFARPVYRDDMPESCGARPAQSLMSVAPTAHL